MKPIIKLSLRSLIDRPIRIVLTLISVIFSTVLVVSGSGFSLTLILTSYVGEVNNDFIITLIMGIIMILFFAALAAVMIYTAIGMRFDNKTKTLGALTALGASDSQKIMLLVTELFVYAAVGVSAGILIGYYITKNSASGFLKILDYHGGYYYDSTGEVYYYELSKEAIYRHTLIVSTVVSVLSVTGASFVPVIRLTRMSVIDSMKSGNKVNIALRKPFVTELMSKLFGRLGLLAGQNCTNYKARFRGIAWTLSGMCIIIVFIRSFALYASQIMQKDYTIIRDENTLKIVDSATSGLIMSMALIVIVCAASMTIVSMSSRKREFATLCVIGLTENDIRKMLMIETLYTTIYTVIYSMAGSVIGNLILLIFSNTFDEHRFDFPFGRFFITIAFILVFCLLLGIYQTARVKSYDLAGETRQ